jgi:hypothetical protein
MTAQAALLQRRAGQGNRDCLPAGRGAAAAGWLPTSPLTISLFFLFLMAPI